jgi:hypothetical protein
MKEKNLIIWDAIQDNEIDCLNRLTEGMEMLDRMGTIYAYLGDIERAMRMKWLNVAKEEGTYKAEYFCKYWK